MFHTIRMPNPGDTWPIRYISNTLSVLSNCLALIFFYDTREDEGSNFEIWIMNEYGLRKLGPKVL